MVVPALNTQGRGRQPSLYDRVFNDPSVNPPEVDIFRLNNSGKELDNPDLLIGEHLAEISVALGVGADDLGLLLAEELPDRKLNLANLTRLYQVWTLAKALRITVSDYLSLTSAHRPRPVRRSRRDRELRRANTAGPRIRIRSADAELFTAPPRDRAGGDDGRASRRTSRQTPRRTVSGSPPTTNLLPTRPAAGPRRISP